LHLDVLGEDREAFGLDEAGDGVALRLDAQAAAALPFGRDPEIADDRFHRRPRCS